MYRLQVNRESLLIKIEAFSYQTESFYKWCSQWIYKTETQIKVVIPVITLIDTESKIFPSTCSLALNPVLNNSCVYMYILKECTCYIKF